MNKGSYRVRILGCPVDNLSLEETLGLIDKIIEEKKISQHVVINVNKLLQARREPELLKIIDSCRIINVDGVPILWAAKILGVSIKERIAGIDLMDRLLERAALKGYSVFFLGAEEDIVRKVVKICCVRYPNLKIAGYRNGYWKEEEEKEVVEYIKQCRPDILFVAISSPKKEKFLSKYLEEMGIPFVMGVGGAFDVIGGKTKRAPKWIQRIGLEWFFRLIQEPKRLWKRYLIGNALFLWLVFKEFIKIKILKKRSQ